MAEEDGNIVDFPMGLTRVQNVFFTLSAHVLNYAMNPIQSSQLFHSFLHVTIWNHVRYVHHCPCTAFWTG